jgi:predicted RNA-binding protein
MMNDTLSLAELEDRIAVLRGNLRQLVEQAAAASGSQNEERIADRIAQQEEELNKLISERDRRAKK